MTPPATFHLNTSNTEQTISNMDSSMRRCVSMLEMKEIEEIHEFDDAVEALTHFSEDAMEELLHHEGGREMVQAVQAISQFTKSNSLALDNVIQSTKLSENSEKLDGLNLESKTNGSGSIYGTNMSNTNNSLHGRVQDDPPTPQVSPNDASDLIAALSFEPNINNNGLKKTSSGNFLSSTYVDAEEEDEDEFMFLEDEGDEPSPLPPSLPPSPPTKIEKEPVSIINAGNLDDGTFITAENAMPIMNTLGMRRANSMLNMSPLSKLPSSSSSTMKMSPLEGISELQPLKERSSSLDSATMEARRAERASRAAIRKRHMSLDASDPLESKIKPSKTPAEKQKSGGMKKSSSLLKLSSLLRKSNKKQVSPKQEPPAFHSLSSSTDNDRGAIDLSMKILPAPARSALKRNLSFAPKPTNIEDNYDEEKKVDEVPSKNDETKMKRNVSFASVKFREYNMTLGDHPCCSNGPAISLGWQYNDTMSLCIDKYESKREPRRTKRQMVMTYYYRRNLLINQAGYSSQDIIEATKAINKIQQQRMRTRLSLDGSPLDKAVVKIMNIVQPSNK